MKFSIHKRIFISCLIIIYLCHSAQGAEVFKNGASSKVQKSQQKLEQSPTSQKATRRQLDDDRRTLLTTILNASGVLGLGFLWIKEITAAIGSPILAPVLMPPLVVVATFVLFFPNIGRVIESILFPM